MPNIQLDPKTKAWVMLFTLAIGTGCAIGVTSYAGGCKPWIAALTGIGAAGSAVYHALNDSPKDKEL